MVPMTGTRRTALTILEPRGGAGHLRDEEN